MHDNFSEHLQQVRSALADAQYHLAIPSLEKIVAITPDDDGTFSLILTQCYLEADASVKAEHQLNHHFEKKGFDARFRAHPIWQHSIPDYCRRHAHPCVSAPSWNRIQIGSEMSVPEPAFLAELPNCTLLGTTFLPLMQDGFILMDSLIHNPNTLRKNIRCISDFPICGMGSTKTLLLRETSESIRQEDEAILLGSHENFGHFLLNHVARIFHFEGKSAWRNMPVVVRADLPKKHQEVLAKFGIDQSRLMPVKPDERIHFNRLWTSSMLYGAIEDKLTWSPDMVRKLNQTLSQPHPKPHRKLFLGRQGARWRRLLNEETLFDRLAEFGFERFEPQHLSAAEEARFMGEAVLFVGVCGAGMNAQFFLPPGRHLIELKYTMPSMDIHPHVSRILEQEHVEIFGEPDSSSATAPIHWDFSVNSDEVIKVVESVLHY